MGWQLTEAPPYTLMFYFSSAYGWHPKDHQGASKIQTPSAQKPVTAGLEINVHLRRAPWAIPTKSHIENHSWLVGEAID